MHLIVTKSHMVAEKFHTEQDNTGIHCRQVSKMKNPSPSLSLLLINITSVNTNINIFKTTNTVL